MKLNRHINKVAVVGSGIMGSRIACHFANIGVEVLLLDIVPFDLKEDQKQDKVVRNSIVNDALKHTLKSKPSPIYSKSFSSRINTGNLEDDLDKIREVDWIIEVVVEQLYIKKQVFEKIEQYRKEGTLISSNTSGIPIENMIDGRSEDFQKHFCGTHFFNPPRYLKLLEIIPTTKTDTEVTDFLMNYGDKFLGKDMVLCKDTPAFIANRIGVANIMSLFHLVKELDLTVEEVDSLSGPIIGRPKSATFRTCDLVGLDTLIHVANGVYENCPNDEMRGNFKLPDFINKMIENNLLGDKTKQGFYKKSKDGKGKRVIEALNLNTLEYAPKQRVKFATIAAAKQEDDLLKRLKVLIKGKDKAGEFYRKSFYSSFAYVSHRIPEITDDLYKIDRALCAGFGWEIGPFQMWDTLDVEKTLSKMEENGYKAADWVYDMIKSGNSSFYSTENGILNYYNIPKKSQEKVTGMENFIILNHIRDNNTIWSNSGCYLTDIGDGIVNLEWRTKMNSIGGEVLEGIQKSIEIAEKNHKGLVIANQGTNFSVGANIAMIFMMAIEQEYEEIDFAVRAFQNTTGRIRYSSVPVVVATHGMTLGGGCEISLHADHVQAASETYIGLVEMGVGVIPGGGGTKEMAKRASESYFSGDIQLPTIKERYLNIGMAKVATSAEEALELDLLIRNRDKVTIGINNLITDAKSSALTLANQGYTKPVEKKIKALGKEGLGMFIVGAHSMHAAGYITEHEKLMSEKLAYAICGGDLSSPTLVSEQYLLDLEREAFLSLCGERKTLERIEHMLKNGKPLRN
ncbi:MAG: 3-hydroxyacyl-CoA dehydrogenase [Flavobacteriales bacterium]|nr:3-hydroxyacyl-CoA dehydrogenase [Flavobacteriales bacterium]|tara:strand:+ start:188 stop:2578 length:2391 start_codon:yes stop_codon:yes gene_type:complete